jgi:hypothetical protein
MSNKNNIIAGKIKCGANSKKRINLGPGAKEEMEKKMLMEWFLYIISVITTCVSLVFFYSWKYFK